VSIGEKLM